MASRRPRRRGRTAANGRVRTQWRTAWPGRLAAPSISGEMASGTPLVAGVEAFKPLAE